MRSVRGFHVRAHTVRHHLLLGPGAGAERNQEQRQRDGLSRDRYEGDWRRATPHRSFINGAAVPYSVAARAVPPIGWRAAPLLLTSLASRGRPPPAPAAWCHPQPATPSDTRRAGQPRSLRSYASAPLSCHSLKRYRYYDALTLHFKQRYISLRN